MGNLNPSVAAWLDRISSTDELPGSSTDHAALRESWNAFLVGHHGLVRDHGRLDSVEDLTTPGGVPVRIYRPAVAPRSGSVHVHLHGGGWWMGSIATVDAMSRELAATLNMTVVSVEYRLAPESPWPAALDDVYETLVWLDTTFDRISIGGESAGANIALAATLMARDRSGPQLVAQWLDVPAVDLRLPSDESSKLYASGYGVEASTLPTLATWYAGDAVDHPHVSPATAELAGLPATIITTAEFDPLRDQGEAFARALLTAGVPVECRRAEGHVHGSSWLTGLDDTTARWYDDIVAVLASHHDAHELELTS